MEHAALRLAPVLLLLAIILSPLGARSYVLEYEGRISIVIPPFGEVEVATGAGVAEIDSPQITNLDLQGFVAGTTLVPVTDPLVSNGGLVAIQPKAKQTRAHFGFDLFGGPFSEPVVTTGSAPVMGELRFCLISLDCVDGLGSVLELSSLTTTSLGAMNQVGVGAGGIITFGGTGTVMISLIGAPFSVNTRTATGRTENGGVVTLTSSGSIVGPYLNSSTAGVTGGHLALVAPTRIMSGQSVASQDNAPLFVRLDIDFVPEPGTFLVLASGSLALFALARVRERAAGNKEAVKRQ